VDISWYIILIQLNMTDLLQNYFESRKITKATQELFNLSINDNIIIPVHDLNGEFSFNKYRRSPLSNEQPKYWYDKGGKVTLYGWHEAQKHSTILLTEGELDCLVAWSHNIPAITSTGGAMSFQEDWVELLKDKDIIICFDNDDAGARGTVRVLNYLPNAKVLLLPDRANVKDISDYVSSGGDLHALLKTAKHFRNIQEVCGDRSERVPLYRPHLFHDVYIATHTVIAPKDVPFKSQASDAITRAKEYPMTNLMTFHHNKALCPFHKEKSGSFTYYPENNSAYCFGCSKVADSIEIYKIKNNCSFTQAVDEINKLQV